MTISFSHPIFGRLVDVSARCYLAEDNLGVDGSRFHHIEIAHIDAWYEDTGQKLHLEPNSRLYHVLEDAVRDYCERKGLLI